MIHSIPEPELVTLLKTSTTIAVVGASANPARPSHWISQYLMGQGFRVIPVNPGHEELFGLSCYPDLRSIPETIDIVNIFRRADSVLTIVESALKRADLKLIWMQDNVYSEAAFELAKQAGIPVVMDDCIYRTHRRLQQTRL